MMERVDVFVPHPWSLKTFELYKQSESEIYHTLFGSSTLHMEQSDLYTNIY